MKSMLNGEPEVIPETGEFIWACCDCSLVHLARLIRRKKQLILYTYRDDYATAKLRREERKRNTRGRVRRKKKTEAAKKE